MKETIKPVRTTIIFGLAAALLSVPLSLAIGPFLFWPKTVALLVWLCLVGYGLLLSRWSKKNPAGILFPSLLLLVAGLAGTPLSVFVLLGMTTLAWIRSSICFPGPPFPTLVKELLLNGGGFFLILFCRPLPWLDTVGIATGIWLFFLVQSLYFIIVPLGDPTGARAADPFDQAQRQAEKIMAGG